MRRRTTELACAMLLVLGVATLVTAGVTLPDSDSDGVPDEWDNCTLSSNPVQLDSDLDGHGNACDCDFNQDGYCDVGDMLRLGQSFNQPVTPATAVTDMNGDGGVDIADFLLFGSGFNAPPGPSGLACADPSGGTAPCSGV